MDLHPDHLAVVKDILKKRVSFAEVRAFGSRVTGKAQKHSDFDLVVVAEGPLASPLLSLLQGDFEESNLPFRVDVLDWHAISGRFQNLILKKYEVIQKAG
ncbi:MAG: hypothetical protein A3H42_04780 [Deltaproteobacteria bacterium RIFCSPLOWO2_02_FULL_46_8]|nr:MAG: hypothetical protein A3H42_04780 [Deltaproteobacteria bacterium RIFCSPLOWO2_02_FULL_46_8]